MKLYSICKETIMPNLDIDNELDSILRSRLYNKLTIKTQTTIRNLYKVYTYMLLNFDYTST
jgi:hypothetical protein